MKLPRLLFAFATAGMLSVLAPAQSATPQNTVIESDGAAEMITVGTETTITFRDNVRVTGTNMKLNCDYLQVIVISGGDQTATLTKLERFRSMIATGNVRMVQGFREAACGRAEVLPGEEKVVLSGNPVVVDHDQKSRAEGETITMLRGQRQVIVTKPIFTLPEVKDLGADKLATPKPEAPKQP